MNSTKGMPMTDLNLLIFCNHDPLKKLNRGGARRLTQRCTEEHML